MIAKVVVGVCFAYLVVNLFFLRLQEPTKDFPDDEEHFNATLSNILKPRSPGSKGHDEVRDFLLLELKRLGFDTHRDEFVDEITFTNVMGVMNLGSPNYLMLTCHYDTQRKRGDNFVAATDAAVSCAMLLNMAKTLGPYLREVFKNRGDIGLVLVFFDGHDLLELSVDGENGLYGSRRFTESEPLPLENIEVMIALNLIGAPNQSFRSHHESTFSLHKMMAEIEEALIAEGHMQKNHKLFHIVQDHNRDFEDDHYQFLNEGVPVMHLVPHTYPKVWNTVDDNAENLHWPTIQNMNAILRRFVHQYIENHDDYVSFRGD
ncbi:glutaminyl-peptide cyclotransferase-like protein [Scaptodrosophila lebanonensis]|uniref:glutaminyl-peptide cyclotransferase n=1 Tax=Drosophila lebanonensis TaxID=7225 RepID=A0A6J2T811_DROLE|nr:glutaminyl-peptide cyclotransferase-like protein [Scaptodrosophila lebanonensis]